VAAAAACRAPCPGAQPLMATVEGRLSAAGWIAQSPSNQQRPGQPEAKISAHSQRLRPQSPLLGTAEDQSLNCLSPFPTPTDANATRTGRSQVPLSPNRPLYTRPLQRPARFSGDHLLKTTVSHHADAPSVAVARLWGEAWARLSKHQQNRFNRVQIVDALLPTLLYVRLSGRCYVQIWRH
jgi:hypothetical protein